MRTNRVQHLFDEDEMDLEIGADSSIECKNPVESVRSNKIRSIGNCSLQSFNNKWGFTKLISLKVVVLDGENIREHTPMCAQGHKRLFISYSLWKEKLLHKDYNWKLSSYITDMLEKIHVKTLEIQNNYILINGYMTFVWPHGVM